MADNFVLRAALTEVTATPTRAQLVAVCRQLLQGDLILTANGDFLDQFIRRDNPHIGLVVEGGRKLLAAFSTQETFDQLRASQGNPHETYSVTKKAAEVLDQVISGGFDGLVVDQASAPHRVSIPTQVIQSLLAEAEPNFTIKTLLAAPRDAETIASLVEALTTTNTWAGGHESDAGQIALAQIENPDGSGNYLLLFSHPWEVTVLGNSDRPLVMAPKDLARTLAAQPEIAGVIIDPAGPSIAVSRKALERVVALAG